MLGELLHVPGARRVVMPLRQRAELSKILPEDRQVVEPLAAIVKILMLHVVGIGGDAEIAAIRLGLIRIG